jgi:hypothetical protein
VVTTARLLLRVEAHEQPVLAALGGGAVADEYEPQGAAAARLPGGALHRVEDLLTRAVLVEQ